MTTQELNRVSKDYSYSFAIDKPKLDRILNIFEDKFAGQEEKLTTNYELSLLNRKKIELKTLDEVLQLDNTVRNPITSLSLTVRGTSETDQQYSHIGFTNREEDNISLTVSSSDAKWANRLFAEVEEQLERTFLANWVYKTVKRSNSAFVFIVQLSLLIGCAAFGTWLLTHQQEDGTSDAQIAELVRQIDTITSTEGKVDFLFELRKLEIEKAIKKKGAPSLASNFKKLLSFRTLFMSLPLIIIVGCMVYLFKYCYPRAVFAWGDYGDHYALILSRRRTLWTVVMLSLLLGIISNLFVFGLSQSL